MKTLQRALAAAAAMALSACASQAPAPRVAHAAPAQWQAPLPHNGSVDDLAGWWQRQGDALLVQLIAAAQEVSPSVAAARSRIAQSRAERVGSGAALGPTLDANASASRTSQQSAQPLGTTAQAALQAAWEIDLFGANRAARDAAQARLDGAHAGWHDARVSVAAEVANQYYSLRACARLLAVAQQGAACERDVKALVALTALAEPALRRQLAGSATAAPSPALAPAALPAQTLAQRPDVFAAEREVAAASFDVGAAQAQRYPRLTLSGAVGVANFRSAGSNTGADTWSIGPLALTLPLFDGGRRRANVDAAAARYDEAVAKYRGSVRQAVREVEEALVNLDSTGQRGGHAETALAGYRSAFDATEQRYRNGLASLLELEDARRTRLAAENTVVNLARERSAAWVALYRAAGGGWNASAAD